MVLNKFHIDWRHQTTLRKVLTVAFAIAECGDTLRVDAYWLIEYLTELPIQNLAFCTCTFAFVTAIDQWEWTLKRVTFYLWCIHAVLVFMFRPLRMTNLIEIIVTDSYKVATAQGRQRLWVFIFPDREFTKNNYNYVSEYGIYLQHRSKHVTLIGLFFFERSMNSRTTLERVSVLHVVLCNVKSFVVYLPQWTHHWVNNLLYSFCLTLLLLLFFQAVVISVCFTRFNISKPLNWYFLFSIVFLIHFLHVVEFNHCNLILHYSISFYFFDVIYQRIVKDFLVCVLTVR